jgi:type IV pilus assembly protein PilB
MVLFDDKNREEKVKSFRVKEEEDLAKILSVKYGVEYVDLSQVSINTDALKLIPENEARENKVALFSKLNKKLSLAVLSPKSTGAQTIIENLEKEGYKIKVFMVSNKSLESAWIRYKDISFSTETKAGVLTISDEQIKESIKRARTVSDVVEMMREVLAMKKSYRISRIVETVLAGALSLEASDIHIEPEESTVRIRFRLNGILTNIINLNQETYKLLLSRIKLLSGLKLNVHKEAQDGRFSINLGHTDIEIRTSALPGAYGESIVLRILNPESIKSSIEVLGIDEDLFKAIKKELSKPNGMILNTGPTGSGKTTTLYAFLSLLHRPEIKIITIEDPIEYHLPGIVQTQVDREKKYSFSSGLRASLRQDPDIIMVGEIRDKETASIALDAALTGHLVLSTLHTNSAAGTFPRLIDLGINPKIIGPAINITMAQRLVRMLREDKKKKVPLEGQDKEDVLRILAGVADKSKIPQTNYVWVPDIEGEDVDSAYSDRIGIYEAVIVDKEMKKFLSDSPREAEITDEAKKQGLLDMREDGVIKVLNGVTSLQEVRRVIDL